MDFRMAAERLLDVCDALDQSAIVAITDRRGVITYVNDRFCEVSKYAGEELVGRTHRIVRSGIHDEDYFRQMWDTILSGRTWRGEFCNRAKDGSLYWVDTTIVPSLGVDGTPYQFVAIRYDITEWKLAEERARASENKYFSLLMHMPTGLADLEAVYNEKGEAEDFRLADLNQAILGFFGKRREELVGKSCSELFPRYGFPTEWGNACAAIAESAGTQKLGDYHFAPANRWFSASAFSVTRGRVACLIEDITERKVNERELERARALAEEANRAKSQFLANISHEIRTPLNGIIGLTELTLLSEVSNEQRENLAIVASCADALRKVINDVLDLAKIEAGKMEVEREAFDLNDLAAKTVASHALAAVEKGLRLELRFDPDVLPRRIGDAAKIRQVLHNLIGNALKFTESGGVFVKVEALPEAGGGSTLLFDVTDTGIGIAEEHADKLFRAFHQVDGSYTRKYGGSGLGLAISKQLVERMGGRLWAESRLGAGSSFRFTLELEPEPSRAAPSAPSAVRETEPAVRDAAVLIVDDDPVSRKIMADALRACGMRVSTAKDGEEGLESLEGSLPELVLMDIQMPVMDGLEAIRRIRAHPDPRIRGTPVIAVTAHALRSDERQYYEQGASAFISKPISLDGFVRTIQEVLDSKATGERGGPE